MWVRLRAAACVRATSQRPMNDGASLPGLRALLVSHRGVLVAERYYAGAGPEDLQPINSATKSVCSMLVGQALRDGRIRDLDETFSERLPDAIAEVPDSPARSVTLRQVLSGRSGVTLVQTWPCSHHVISSPPWVLNASNGGVTATGTRLHPEAWRSGPAMCSSCRH